MRAWCTLRYNFCFLMLIFSANTLLFILEATSAALHGANCSLTCFRQCNITVIGVTTACIQWLPMVFEHYSYPGQCTVIPLKQPHMLLDHGLEKKYLFYTVLFLYMLNQYNTASYALWHLKNIDLAEFANDNTGILYDLLSKKKKF